MMTPSEENLPFTAGEPDAQTPISARSLRNLIDIDQWNKPEKQWPLGEHVKRGSIVCDSVRYSERFIFQLPDGSKSHVSWKLPATDVELQRVLRGLPSFLMRSGLRIPARYKLLPDRDGSRVTHYRVEFSPLVGTNTVYVSASSCAGTPYGPGRMPRLWSAAHAWRM